jgi:hypothetical protein
LGCRPVSLDAKFTYIPVRIAALILVFVFIGLTSYRCRFLPRHLVLNRFFAGLAAARFDVGFGTHRVFSSLLFVSVAAIPAHLVRAQDRD